MFNAMNTDFFNTSDGQNVELYREDIIERLESLDMELCLKYDNSLRASIIIVGGSALILMNMLTRYSYDIDTLACSEEILEFMDKYNMNSDVVAYLDCFPEDYKSRLKRIPTSCVILQVFTPSLEDIVISKLASPRSKDDLDIHSPAILDSVDLNLLEELVNNSTVQEGFLSDRARRNFEIDYSKYLEDVRRYRNESWNFLKKLY